MSMTDLRCLIALADEGDLDRAALACGASPAEFAHAITVLEAEFGSAVLSRADTFTGITPQGEQVLAWARRQIAESDTLQSDLRAMRGEAALTQLLERRSVSPKRLARPGPDSQGIDLIIQAALRAPDHGGLHPWRIIEFREEQRADLADRFEQEKLRRDPLATTSDRQRAREHATQAPVLLGFVVAPRARGKIPLREQWLSAGAALGNLLNAAHQLGFGAIVLSGDRCFDTPLCRQIGVRPNEYLAGFITIGSMSEAPPVKRHSLPGEVWSCWVPPIGHGNEARPAGKLRPVTGE